MRLDDITPVILTYNEEPNIRRTLRSLEWATEIVVVDSGSTDRTLEILREFRSVRVLQHAFENHALQWHYAISQSNISTEWVLGLDADLILPSDSVQEIAALPPDGEIGGYESQFRYCVLGHPLPRSIFPARILLFRRARVSFHRDGHAHRVGVAGRVESLRCLVDHDDRKPVTRWLASQDVYARLEREKLLAVPHQELLSCADRVRARRFMAPIAVLLYCLFVKRLIFAGLPGWYYTYQRVLAEVLLSLYLIEHELGNSDRP